MSKKRKTNYVSSDLTIALGPVMKKAGFHRNSDTWYRYDGPILQVLSIGMTFSERLPIWVGILWRPFNRSTHPRIMDCHVYGDLNCILREDNDAFDVLRNLKDEKSNCEERVSKLLGYVVDNAIPFLGGIAADRALNLGYYDARLADMFDRQPEVLGPLLAELPEPGYYRSFNLDAELREREFIGNWASLVDDILVLLQRFQPDLVATESTPGSRLSASATPSPSASTVYFDRP